MAKYLIIGGGIAGVTAAAEIRKAESDAEITIIHAEQHRLYSRVLLPHYVKEKVPREKVFLKTDAWYQEQKIEVFFGVQAEKIDIKNKFVFTSEGRELPFDKLLITTGTQVRLAKEDIRGVSYLYSLDDADHLKQLIKEVISVPEEERFGAVYGGGFIACEYANAFKKYGIKTAIVMRSSGFWSKILSDASQKILADHAISHGVNVYTEIDGIEFSGNDQVEEIICSNGEKIPANIVGIGIGAIRDIEFIKEAGIDCGYGVKTDEYLQTNVQDIFAAGDVAEFFDITVDRSHTAGNYMSAMMQGRLIGKNMTGSKDPFILVSSYATNLLEKEIVFIGDVSRSDADEVVALECEQGAALEIFQRDERTVGAVLIGNVTERQKVTNAIKLKQNYLEIRE